MKGLKLTIIIAVTAVFSLVACSSAQKTTTSGDESADVSAPVQFEGDSAFAMVKAQCDFGPRVPGTVAHRKAGDFLVAKLAEYGANVIEQKGNVTTFDGVTLEARNIIAEFNAEAERRILLLAHWDCRPWADSDADEANHKKPVMGANDGASGVGVLLEVARQLQIQLPSVGVDILLVDVEDWGDDNGGNEESWALGTQYWVKHKHKAGYKPLFAILLDMVGASDAVFKREYYSIQYSQGLVGEVWQKAIQSGYANYFSNDLGGGVTDDHIFINKAGIPCIDIIDTRNTSTGFFPAWHTTHDTIDCISPTTLKAVGQTLLNVIWGL